MAANTKTDKQLSLKLVVSKETNKVIFAEAGKEVVDILCSFLTLPLGTIARLVKKDSDIGPVTVGCLNSLYHSVENLDKEHLLIETSKEMLQHPKNSSEDYCSTLELNIDDTQPTNYFMCSNIFPCTYPGVSASPNNICASCKTDLTFPVSLKRYFSKGFVSSVATFLITDELIIMPNCMENMSLSALQNLGIKDRSSVTETTVTVTKQKVLDLLKCALLSKTTLTDVFLWKKPSLETQVQYLEIKDTSSVKEITVNVKEKVLDLLKCALLSLSTLTVWFLGKKPSLEKSMFFSCDVENTSTIQIKVKLFMRKTDLKILFCQGEEDFADLILSFLKFPLGVVVSKLGGMCSIDGLHKSIADLDEKSYFLSKDAKNRLLDPPLTPCFKFSKQILPFQQLRLPFYCHFLRDSYDGLWNGDLFINHEHRTTYCRKTHLVNPESSSHEVYVKGPRTFVVTDDLVIAPASPISTLDLINHLGTTLEDLQEKVVTIGYKECLNILKASLTSTSALTIGLSHLLPKVMKENCDKRLHGVV